MMSNNRLNVFIQDLSDTTTVLQQLEVCIKNIKSILGYIDNKELYMHSIRISGSYAGTSFYNRRILVISTLSLGFDSIESFINWIKEDENRKNCIFLMTPFNTMLTIDNDTYPTSINCVSYDYGSETLTFGGDYYNTDTERFVSLNPIGITISDFEDTIIKV